MSLDRRQIAETILKEMQEKFKVSIDYALASQCRERPSCHPDELKVKTLDQLKEEYRIKTLNKTQGTAAGMHYAIEYLVGDIREEVNASMIASGRGCYDLARDRVVLESSNCGKCQELTSYAIIRFMEHGIMPERMHVISKIILILDMLILESNCLTILI